MISLTAVELRIGETKILDGKEFAVTAVPDSSKGERIVLLVKEAEDPEDIARKLRKSGMPPLMQPGILDFLKEVKNIGYAVKLDTNGTNPERLRALLSAGIVDYVAMDYKNCREKYALTAGVPETTGAILYENTRLSMSFIRQSGVEHEYRTTIVKELHTVDDVRKMAQELEGEEK